MKNTSISLIGRIAFVIGFLTTALLFPRPMQAQTNPPAPPAWRLEKNAAPALHGVDFGLRTSVTRPLFTKNVSIREQEVNAYARLNWYPDLEHPENPLMPYYEGTASFSAYAKIANQYSNDIFNPQIYKWSADFAEYLETQSPSNAELDQIQHDFGPNGLDIGLIPDDQIEGNLRQVMNKYHLTSAQISQLVKARAYNDPSQVSPELKSVLLDQSSPNKSLTWNFGDATEFDGVPFHADTQVKVLITGEGANTSILGPAKATVHWFSVFDATPTGLQVNAPVTPEQEVLMADGTWKKVSDVKPGDSVMVWENGQGTLGQHSQVISVRPVNRNDVLPPAPGKPAPVPKTVITVDNIGSNSAVIHFGNTVHIDPETDPNAPGYEELRQIEDVEKAYQGTLATGGELTALAIETLYIDVAKLPFYELTGAALSAGIVKTAELLEKASELTQVAAKCDAAAAKISELLPGLRALKARGQLSPAQAEKLALKIEEFQTAQSALNGKANEARNLASQARKMGEEAQAELETTQYVELIFPRKSGVIK